LFKLFDKIGNNMNKNSTQQYCCVEFSFKFSENMVNKRDFLTIFNL
jgi:hypothetical protein